MGGWSTPRPGRFTPGKDPVPILQEAGWPQGRSGQVRKISPTPGFDPRTVQPVASRYSDWDIPAHQGDGNKEIHYQFPKKNYAPYLFRCSCTQCTVCHFRHSFVFVRSKWKLLLSELSCISWQHLQKKWRESQQDIYESNYILKQNNSRYNIYFTQYCCIFLTLVLPTFLYGSENWTLTALQRRRIEAAEMKLLRPLAVYTLYDHKTNDYKRRELRITGVLDKIDEYRRNWLQHLQRMPQNRIPLKSYHYRPQGRRTIGRPKKRWCEQL